MKNLKAHIVQVIPHYPPFIGGMELRVEELVTKLAAQGQSITVLTSDQHTNARVEKKKNITVKYLKSYEIAHTPIIFGLAKQLFQIQKTSIVHVHIAQALTPEIVAFICRIRKIPFIAHVRLDVPASGTFGKLVLPLYKKLFLRTALHLSQHVIVLTEDYRTLINKKYGIDKSKISVIPNATDYKILKKSRSFPRKPFRMLSVGRLTSQKNIPLLLRGIKEYIDKNKHISLNLKIVGDGEQMEELKRLTHDLNLNSVVEFTGSQRGKQLENTYESSDLFVLTSTHESFGTVLIEAMTKGLPVIATNIDAVRNVLHNGENSMLIDQNQSALCDAINKLTSDAEVYEKYSHASLELAKKYNWQQVVDETLDVYGRFVK